MSINLYKFYIIKPQAGTNLVKNPQPYTSTGGYSAYGSGTTIAVDDTHSRRGPACIKVTPASGITTGVSYSGINATAGLAYSFSADVKGVKGQAMSIYVLVDGGAQSAAKNFVATGNWQRISYSFVSADTGAAVLAVQREAVASTSPFWVDGFQLEQSVKPTTWIYGYERGLGYIDDSPEYSWEGAPSSSVTGVGSVSLRNPLTRHGGGLVDIATYADIVGAFGLGMGPLEQVTTPIVTG